MQWSDKNTALLKKLWAEGLSAVQIAERIEGATNRSVTAKAHRLGLVDTVTNTAGAAVSFYWKDDILYVRGKPRIKLPTHGFYTTLAPFIVLYNEWCEDPAMMLEDIAEKLDIRTHEIGVRAKTLLRNGMSSVKSLGSLRNQPGAYVVQPEQSMEVIQAAQKLIAEQKQPLKVPTESPFINPELLAPKPARTPKPPKKPAEKKARKPRPVKKKAATAHTAVKKVTAPKPPPAPKAPEPLKVKKSAAPQATPKPAASQVQNEDPTVQEHVKLLMTQGHSEDNALVLARFYAGKQRKPATFSECVPGTLDLQFQSALNGRPKKDKRAGGMTFVPSGGKLMNERTREDALAAYNAKLDSGLRMPATAAALLRLEQGTELLKSEQVFCSFELRACGITAGDTALLLKAPAPFLRGLLSSVKKDQETACIARFREQEQEVTRAKSATRSAESSAHSVISPQVLTA